MKRVIPNRNFFVSAFVAAGVLVCLVGCQTPTKVKENPARKLDPVAESKKPIEVTAETVILDARPRFDYSVARIPRSISLQWWDFTEPEAASRGRLQDDLFALTRRLARIGIDPMTSVVVVGRGPEGGGEEGRIAWMLRYLGVGNVQFTKLEALRPRLTNVAEESGIAEKPMWKPQAVESLDVRRAELLFAINSRGTQQPVVYPPGSKEATTFRIIDVRSEKAYLGREGIGSRTRVPNMDAINVPWKEFFDADLRPEPSMAERLQQVGIRPTDRIIVLDEDGVASAAVTLALRSLGFPRAGNLSGGLTELLSPVRSR